ncbi:MAG: type II toxin-antitoxin system HicA family toxin [Myxococcales bacterium]|nr:MAG: type II toxin-antitoxin system HicA family toxin [Myxococcales bacterium]
MPVSGKQVIRRLLAQGWQRKGQQGSHVKMIKGDTIVVVPVHGNKDLGKGLLKAIEKQSGVKLR